MTGVLKRQGSSFLRLFYLVTAYLYYIAVRSWAFE